MLRSSVLRLAALYTAIFAAAVIVLGVLTLLSLRSGLSEIFDTAIQNETLALKVEFETEGRDAVLYAVRDRDNNLLHHYYGMEAADGSALAGRLAGRKIGLGWSDLALQIDGEEVHVRTYGVEVGGAYRVIVGDDVARIEQLDRDILRGFIATLLAVVLAGGVGGFVLSRGVHRRLDAIAQTADAISDGDLARRVPLWRGDADLDRLAVTINRMLDRISALMESVRQVSNDVAHDLRTPLTRLRQHLEAGAASDKPGEQQAALESALVELDEVLETFSAILRISQIQGGARQAGFKAIDLTQIAANVVETLAPVAEEEGRVLAFSAPGPAPVEGDGELLTQMLVNLIENALRHTPPGVGIAVAVSREADGVALSVTDAGPGIAPAERQKVFERFYRLEASRTTPGSGLGLALALAVARMHGGTIELRDAEPGLEAQVFIPV